MYLRPGTCPAVVMLVVATDSALQSGKWQLTDWNLAQANDTVSHADIIVGANDHLVPR